MIVYNRNDAGLSTRLSNSVVSLRNYQGATLKTWTIGDATNIPVFDVNFELYLGCYNDADGNERDLHYKAGVLFVNGHTNCGQLCSVAGYLFAGTQYSNECWCGNSYGRHGANTGGCSMTCSGNSAEMCGGPHQNSVYRTICSSCCNPSAARSRRTTHSRRLEILDGQSIAAEIETAHAGGNHKPLLTIHAKRNESSLANMFSATESDFVVHVREAVPAVTSKTTTSILGGDSRYVNASDVATMLVSDEPNVLALISVKKEGGKVNGIVKTGNGTGVQLTQNGQGGNVRLHCRWVANPHFLILYLRALSHCFLSISRHL